MYRLSSRNKAILAKKIMHYKKLCFPGKGGGARLADEVGVPPQTVSNWLAGSRQPTAIQLYRLAVAFKVGPLELCGFPPEKTSSRNAAEASILRDMLALMGGGGKSNVNPRVTAKAMENFKAFLEQAIGEMRKQGKEGKM